MQIKLILSIFALSKVLSGFMTETVAQVIMDLKAVHTIKKQGVSNVHLHQ